MDWSTFVKGINIAVIGSITVILDKKPILKKIIEKNSDPIGAWDFFMTIAGVGIYIIIKNPDEKIREELIKELNNFDKQMEAGLNNLIGFVQTNFKEGDNLEPIIGVWVLWNLKGNFPTKEEIDELAPTIGGYLQAVVNDLAGHL